MTGRDTVLAAGECVENTFPVIVLPLAVAMGHQQLSLKATLLIVSLVLGLPMFEVMAGAL